MATLSDRTTFRIQTENVNKNCYFPELLNEYLIMGIRCSFHFLPSLTL